jgi:hypothetical protein
LKLIKQKGGKMKKNVIEKVSALIIAAFGLVAALAWNGAIKAIFAAVFGEAGSISAMITYAVVVTIIAVLVTIWIGKLESGAK